MKEGHSHCAKAREHSKNEHKSGKNETTEQSRGSLKLLIPESRDSLPESKVVKREGKIIKFSI